jgi:hypothetical protein
MAVSMKIADFWDAAQRSLTYRYYDLEEPDASIFREEEYFE